MPQFLVEPAAVRPGEGRAVLAGPEAHHLLRVVRARPGDAVAIFDGTGQRWRGRLSGGGPSEAIIEGLQPLPSNEPPLDVWLVQSLPKGDRWPWILSRGTELGVTRFMPVLSERTVAGTDRDGGRERSDRWASVALSAAKQCERGRVPAVSILRPLGELLGELGDPVPGEVRLLLAERSPGEALITSRDPSRVIIAVGPEGGWSTGEADRLQEAGFLRVNLGARILRCETAALVGLAFVQLRWGGLVGPEQAC